MVAIYRWALCKPKNREDNRFSATADISTSVPTFWQLLVLWTFQHQRSEKNNGNIPVAVCPHCPSASPSDGPKGRPEGVAPVANNTTPWHGRAGKERGLRPGGGRGDTPTRTGHLGRQGPVLNLLATQIRSRHVAFLLATRRCGKHGEALPECVDSK